MPRYIVEKQISDDEQWYKEGEWTDPVKLALAMWELGLMRPEYSAIRIREEVDKVQFHGDEQLLQFLMNKHGVTRAVALIAMNHNSLSVVYASDALSNDICRYQYEREARECGLE